MTGINSGTYRRISLAGIFLLLLVLTTDGQQTISQISMLPVGSIVTTTGTIASDNGFGIIRYLQDNKAGIAVYASELEETTTGDSIIISGVLSRYRGQLQISPVFSYQLISSGNQIHTLYPEDFQVLGQDSFASRKIIFQCAGINTCESILSSGWYSLFDKWGNTTRLSISQDHPSEGFLVSDRPVTIEGIWTKFEDQYQLVCQSITDASEGTCFTIPQGKVFFDNETVSLVWNNVPFFPGTENFLQFGVNDFDNTLDIPESGSTVTASLLPGLLDDGVIYIVRLCQAHPGKGTFYSAPVYCAMPAKLSKPIEILFNRSVDSVFSDGSAPLATGPSVIESDLVSRIDKTTSTLDIAMYNTTRSTIVQAIKRAVDRGVDVRYIADDETSNTALGGQLNFPVLFRSGDGIMHHKFLIGDAADPSRTWLWTGSTNLSTNQLTIDPNHAYIIHDQALVANYLREFEELWGMEAAHLDARYGDFKTNNTAHLFKVGETMIESYFSPSDETNCRLIEALQSADHQALIGLLLLTKEDLVDEIIYAHERGIDIRVILEDQESSAIAFSRLQQAGVPLKVHDPSPIFHHKYAIIDEGHLESDPQVVTGSHNWTWSAEHINDENTLIIHDQSVTNIFRQEYEARWEELNPTSVSMHQDSGISVWPNPANSFLQITNSSPDACKVELINVHGQVIHTYQIAEGQSSTIELNKYARGMYTVIAFCAEQQFVSRIFITE